VPALSALVDAGYSLPATVTQPDKLAGRKQLLSPPPVKLFAEAKKINVLQPATLKDDDFFKIFRGLEPDICVLASYGKIIPERYLSVPKYGFINIHPSLLSGIPRTVPYPDGNHGRKD